MNKVILMGRLTRDPEVRYSNANPPLAIVRYSIAINRGFKKEGQPDADFINCVAFGKTGEFAEKYFSKGKMIAVVGRLQNNNYTDKNDVKHYSMEVIVDEQHFAESKASSDSRAAGGGSSNKSTGGSRYDDIELEGFTPIEETVEEDDLPF